jgi:hypothetical protein
MIRQTREVTGGEILTGEASKRMLHLSSATSPRRFKRLIRSSISFLSAFAVALGSPGIPASAASTFACNNAGGSQATIDACGARWSAANLRAHIAAKQYGGSNAACLTRTASALESLAATAGGLQKRLASKMNSVKSPAATSSGKPENRLAAILQPMLEKHVAKTESGNNYESWYTTLDFSDCNFKYAQEIDGPGSMIVGNDTPQAKVVVSATIPADEVSPTTQGRSITLSNSAFGMSILEGHLPTGVTSVSYKFPKGVQEVVNFASDADASTFLATVRNWKTVCAPSYDVTAQFLADNVPSLGNGTFTNGNVSRTTGFSVTDCVVTWQIEGSDSAGSTTIWALSIPFNTVTSVRTAINVDGTGFPFGVSVFGTVHETQPAVTDLPGFNFLVSSQAASEHVARALQRLVALCRSKTNPF